MRFLDCQHMVRVRSLGDHHTADIARPDITKDAVRYELKMLDDEFFAKRPENLKLMGNPRPELDQAWDEFLGAGFNFRVPKSVGHKAGFDSVELDDGSEDLWATTAFYHNLHCIVSGVLKQAGVSATD